MSKFFRIAALLVTVLALYFKKHFYLIVVVVVAYFLYKLGVHEKIYKLINKVTGNTMRVRAYRDKKNSYVKKMMKNEGGGII